MTIETTRLRLPLISLRLFDACIAGDRETAEQLAGVAIPDDWLQRPEYAKMRRDQLIADPVYAPWCVRMIVLKETNTMIGHIGFHAPPNPEGLRAIAPGGIEFGYTIYEPHRRRAYATEAAIGLMRWAVTEHGIPSFVVSVSPQNVASQAMAKNLGFIKAGEQMDEVDGLEDVLVLRGEPLEFITNTSVTRKIR
ncbi:MAG: GNAT family N-acetyltransferase [Candidatus Hydrogenedentes bacterium]|nr:GNAT family N-acetyltransferase [Candidatus Hydrogenedentota bacterium]